MRNLDAKSTDIRMQKTKLLERIAALTSRIAPQPFGHITQLGSLRGIRCVAFDFYGTMFISGVGDISVDEEKKSSYSTYFTEALHSTGFKIEQKKVGKVGLYYFDEVLSNHIGRLKKRGVDYPEPEIRSVWQEVLIRLQNEGFIWGSINRDNIARFAIEFEFRANTIWPVPQLESILRGLLDRDLMLGIISNSQFYTPLAFKALMGQSPTDFGFEAELQKWSYSEGVKKPSLKLYRQFRDELPDKKLLPEEVLYVGNDLKKDMHPAQKMGFKTALYVGDQRSVRHTPEELNKSARQPDLVLDDLSQIKGCLQG